MSRMNYAYPNLAAEMTRANIDVKDVAEVLNIHVSGVYAMMNGTRNFPIIKAKLLRDKLFPEMSLDYLFAPDAAQPVSI